MGDNNIVINVALCVTKKLIAKFTSFINNIYEDECPIVVYTRSELGNKIDVHNAILKKSGEKILSSIRNGKILNTNYCW